MKLAAAEVINPWQGWQLKTDYWQHSAARETSSSLKEDLSNTSGSSRIHVLPVWTVFKKILEAALRILPDISSWGKLVRRRLVRSCNYCSCSWSGVWWWSWRWWWWWGGYNWYSSCLPSTLHSIFHLLPTSSSAGVWGFWACILLSLYSSLARFVSFFHLLSQTLKLLLPKWIRYIFIDWDTYRNHYFHWHVCSLGTPETKLWNSVACMIIRQRSTR